jgi:hypothetical protein
MEVIKMNQIKNYLNYMEIKLNKKMNLLEAKYKGMANYLASKQNEKFEEMKGDKIPEGNLRGYVETFHYPMFSYHIKEIAEDVSWYISNSLEFKDYDEKLKEAIVVEIGKVINKEYFSNLHPKLKNELSKYVVDDFDE